MEKNFGEIRSGFGKGLVEATKTNKNIVALCADLTDSLKLTEFKEKYPNNFFEFGIAEQNMMSAAAGMCLNNKIPFVTSYAAFNPGRNWDQLRISICYSNHNVKILGGHAGLTTGPDGATHQALEDITLTRVLPNLTIIVPCDEEEMKKATIAAAKYKGPVYLRSTREKSKNITTENSPFIIGKANVLYSKGNDITIIACGITVQFALEAIIKLKKENITANLINLHTIKPLDEKTILKYAKKTNAILTCEEHQKNGGMGSAISELLSQKYPIPIEIIGIDNSFGESGNGYELLNKYNISTKEIINKTKKLIKRKKEFLKITNK
ncbi:MAG: transketolase family protein [Nanoarchaeota archaeon]|nr:transketolase family protein [Nanoarchaeota archaeon]